MQCSVVQCSAVQCSAVQSSTVKWTAAQLDRWTAGQFEIGGSLLGKVLIKKKIVVFTTKTGGGWRNSGSDF